MQLDSHILCPPRNVLYWLNTRFRRKVGECKNPLIRSQHIFHVLRLKNRMPEKQRWQMSPSYKASPHNRLFPAFLTLRENRFFRDAAPKLMSPQYQPRLSL